MELFKDIVLSTSTPQPLAIATPLGTITSSMAVDSISLTHANCSHFYSLANDGFAARWELRSGIGEVIVSRPSMIREYWAEVTDCWAFLWRFKALQPINELTFRASWRDAYTWKTGGPNSGQWLDAQTWDDGLIEVSLGTEGDDALFVRAEASDWLPQRFTRQSTDQYSLSLVRYLDEGMAVDFGEVRPNELFQAHFVIAWAPYDEESVGTWNAVNLNAEHILEGAAGKRELQPRATS